MRNLIRAVLFAITIIPVNAEENSDVKQDYAAYEAVSKIGVEMFFEAYKKNGPIIRTSAMLRACGHDGLATAVEAKHQDRQFTQIIGDMLKNGRFKDLPFSAVLSAQNAANVMLVGYEAGYKDAVALSFHFPQGKAQICAATLKAADEILK